MKIRRWGCKVSVGEGSGLGVEVGCGVSVVGSGEGVGEVDGEGVTAIDEGVGDGGCGPGVQLPARIETRISMIKEDKAGFILIVLGLAIENTLFWKGPFRAGSIQVSSNQ